MDVKKHCKFMHAAAGCKDVKKNLDQDQVKKVKKVWNMQKSGLTNQNAELLQEKVRRKGKAWIKLKNKMMAGLILCRKLF